MEGQKFLPEYPKKPDKGEIKIFESVLLERYHLLFEKLKNDQEGFLKEVNKDPKGFKVALAGLESNFRLFLSDKCFKDKEGQFLKEMESLVTKLRLKIPSELKQGLERISNLILGYYFKKLQMKGSKTLKQMLNESELRLPPKKIRSFFIEKNKSLFGYLEYDTNRLIKSINEDKDLNLDVGLRKLKRDLMNYLETDCIKNDQGQFLKKVETAVSRFNGKLPNPERGELDDIFNLILDYYSKKSKMKGNKTLKQMLKNAKLTLPDKTFRK